MLLEDLDSLAAASSPVPTATAATSVSGRKQKAYGARGKAERKDARRQARKMDTMKRSSSKKQQQNNEEQQQAQAKTKAKANEGIDENGEDNDSTTNAVVDSKSGSGRKAGRSRSSSASAGSALESLVATGASSSTSSSPKPNRRQQPSTKSAKSRNKRVMEEDTNDADMKMTHKNDDDYDDDYDDDGPEVESESESEMDLGQQKQQRIQTNEHDREANNDEEEGEEEGFDNMAMDDVDTDQDEDEEYVEEEEEDGDNDHHGGTCIAAAQTQAAEEKKEAEVGSPPIQPTRTRPYVRGRIKRTIDDDDDDEDGDEDESDADARSSGDDESSPNEEENDDDELIARQNTAKKVYQEADDNTEGNDGQDDISDANKKEKSGQVLDKNDGAKEAQASLGGVLAGTATSTTGTAGRKTQPMLPSPNRRRSHSRGGGDALALMQYAEEQTMENEEADDGDVPESQGTLESFFSGKSDEHLTDPDGDLGNGGLLTQGADITGDNQSVSVAAKKARLSGSMSKHRVVESPHSTNSRLSDAESFQASTGIGRKKKKGERDSSMSMKKNGRRHHDSDDDYQSETDHNVQDSDTDEAAHEHRRRSSRQKQQRENFAWYAGDVETDDDEENEFIDDDEEEEGAGDTNNGEEEVVAAFKSRRRRGGEGAKRLARSSTKSQRTGRSSAVSSETSSIGDESDEQVDREGSPPEDSSTPKSSGKKWKGSSVEQTPKADNRSLTQMGRDAKKEKRQKSSTSSASSSKYGTNTNFSDDGQHDSLSFPSQSQTEANASKQRSISVSKKCKGGPSGGTNKKKGRGGKDPTSRSIPRAKAGTLSKASASSIIEDPFMEKDPSLEAEKEDPIDEFEGSFGVGPVDSDDDNELNSTNFVGERWAPNSPEENDAVLNGSTGTTEVDKAELSSPSTEMMGEAGRRRRRRLQSGGPSSFTSTSVLETGTKLHKPTIRWSPQVTGNHSKAYSSKKKARSGEDQASKGHSFAGDDSDRTHSDSDDEDGDVDDTNALKTQPEEELSQWHHSPPGLSSTGESDDDDDDDDDGDPDYQSSQPMNKSGQQPRQKKRRNAARASARASEATSMTTAGDTSDFASAAAPAPAEGKCRAPSKRVLATITKKLRALSSQNSQNQKDVTEEVKKQALLYLELHQMRSLMESPAHFDSILGSVEVGTNVTIGTFSSSLKFMLSTTIDSGAKIDAEGRRKRLSALCTCLRFFVDVPDVADGTVATDVFNSFSRYGGGRPKFPIVSEDMREALSDPKIVSQLLISVQFQDSIQKRSRPNQVEIKFRAQASYLSCACLSLVDPGRAIDQILSSPSSSSSESTSIKNAIGNLHRLATSLDTMDSYSQVELSLLFLFRIRRILLAISRQGTNERRKKIALKTLKKLDESLPSVYRNNTSRLNMYPPSALVTKGGDGLPFTAWARECSKQGNGHVRTFGCKAVFNPENKDVWGPTIKVKCIHVNKSSLSFFIGDTDIGDEINTFRSTDSSITEEDTDGENASTAAAASFRRDRLSIERLYGTTKLVETYFHDWEDHSAYIRESGAITIYLSSEEIKRSNLARALDEKLRSNVIHIEVVKSEFAEFTDLLKARGVVLVDGVNQDGQPASQDSMGSVTTTSYREDDESRVFEQVEYNTSKIRGARRPQDDTEQSDDDAEIASQDDGTDDEDGRTDVGLEEDHEGMAVDPEESPDKRKPSRPSEDSKDADILKQASVPKRKKSSLGKRKEIPVDHNDGDDNNDDDDAQNDFGPDTATSKGGERRKHKKIEVDQGSARATKKSRQQKKQVAEKQPQIVRAQTREVTPLPESNASGRNGKQPSNSPTPYRSSSTKRTSQNLDTSFARVDGMKKPLASISASCCAMSVVGGSSTAFNVKQAVSDDLAGDVIEYDAALGQAVAALSHVRHLAKKIEDGVGRCKSIDAGSLGRSTEAGYEEGDQSSSSPAAFGWIDESYHQVVEKQKEWIRQRESVEKELSGILLNGLQPASKNQSKTKKKK